MFAPRRWTHEDDRRLLELKAAGKHTNMIGKELRRSEPAVIQRTAILKRRVAPQPHSCVPDQPLHEFGHERFCTTSIRFISR
jgi:hypothetical protein